MGLYTSYDSTTMSKESLLNTLVNDDSGLNIDINSIVVQYGTTSNYYNYYDYTDSSVASSLSFYSPEDGDGLNIDAGLLLSSGSATPPESNTSTNYTGQLYPVGDYELTDEDLTNTAQLAFSGSGTITDATVLEFEFTISDLFIHGITFDLIFGSDEYPEYSDSSYVDIAGIYLNGENVALFNGNETQPLSVISENIAIGNFQDNTNGDIPIEYDGISNKMTIYAPVDPGTNTIKIAVADTGDSSYDSGLYIANLKGTQLQGNGLSSVTSGTDSNDTITGTEDNETFELGDGDDYINPGLGNDIILAGLGNDIIIGGYGDNQIDGGEGFDQVQYLTTFADTYLKIMDNDTVHVGLHSDNLLNVEEIAFTDISFDVEQLLMEDDISKVYIAYFGRAADPEGMTYWLNQVSSEVENGKEYSDSIFSIVSAYAESTEAETIYPGINSGDLTEDEMGTFVNTVYQNLFNRDAEQEGLDYWIEEGMSLQDNEISVGTMVKTIIDGAQDQLDQLDRTYMQNKAQASWNYAKQFELNDKSWSAESNYTEAKNILNTITEDSSSVNDTYDLIIDMFIA